MTKTWSSWRQRLTPFGSRKGPAMAPLCAPPNQHEQPDCRTIERLSEQDFVRYFESRMPELNTRRGGNISVQCPFHEDSNPSFSVNPSQGLWKCFAGCGEGGYLILKSNTPTATAKPPRRMSLNCWGGRQVSYRT